jgi:hypothetical protein
MAHDGEGVKYQKIRLGRVRRTLDKRLHRHK